MKFPEAPANEAAQAKRTLTLFNELPSIEIGFEEDNTLAPEEKLPERKLPEKIISAIPKNVEVVQRYPKREHKPVVKFMLLMLNTIMVSETESVNAPMWVSGTSPYQVRGKPVFKDCACL